jgi:hypothetical protein
MVISNGGQFSFGPAINDGILPLTMFTFVPQSNSNAIAFLFFDFHKNDFNLIYFQETLNFYNYYLARSFQD